MFPGWISELHIMCLSSSFTFRCLAEADWSRQAAAAAASGKSCYVFTVAAHHVYYI